MKYRSSKFKTVSPHRVYPVFVHVLNNNLHREGGWGRYSSCGRINVLNSVAYLMGDPIIFWWTICCKKSALLRDIGKYLFNLKGKWEIRAIKSNVSSNMPKRKYTQRN